MISSAMSDQPTWGPTITLLNLSDEEARGKIISLFEDGDLSLDYGEIADRLCLYLEQTADICGELIKKGILELHA